MRSSGSSNRSKLHSDCFFRLIEMVMGEGPIPAPPPVPRAETQKPTGALLAVAYHEREVPHHAAQVLAVYVREKTWLD